MTYPAKSLSTCLLVAVLAAFGGGGCAALDAPALLGGGGGGAGAGRATFNVTGFGARGNDDADDTVAFRHAIEAVRQLGSGTVTVPPGRYVLGPIDLAGNLTLRLDPAATLVFLDDPDRFPITDTRWNGVMRPARRPLLWADNLANVTITGGGTIDGNGARWWRPLQDAADAAPAPPPPPTTTRAAMRSPSLAAAAVSRPDPGESDPALRRPPLVQLRNCQNVRIEGVTLKDAPHVALHVLFSSGVQVRNVRIVSPPDAVGAVAGACVDSSRNVLIEGCRADVGAAADAVALHSGRDDDGRRMNRPTENVTVRNCVITSALGGLVIGTEMSAGVRNVRFADCRFEGTGVGVLIKSQRGRGGAVEGVTVSNLMMNGVGVPFQITARHLEGPAEPASDRTPRIAGIRFTGLVAKGANRAGIVEGLEESPVRGLEFRNVNLAARYGITCNWASGVEFRNAAIATDFGPGMIRSNTFDVRLDEWQETTPEAATRPAVAR